MTSKYTYIDPTLQEQLNHRDSVFAHYTEAKFTTLRNTLNAVYGTHRKSKRKLRIAPSLLSQIRIQTYKSSSVITPQFVNYPIEVYNGKSFQILLVTPDMVGYPLKAFIQTRVNKYVLKKSKNKKQKKKK